MANLATGSVARQIEALFEGGSAAGLSDRQLLERFHAGRDAGGEAAFAALVARHGPMVLGVCRQVLGDHQLAEDAFQAVFLVLARRARSIREPDLLGNWLYGVALRTARCARDRLARRRKNEEIGTMMRPGPSPTTEPTTSPAEETVAAREHAEALHGEIERLPESFRLPVVLCYLEGLTVHEAARRLRWSHGTVRSRMARAREKLRRALVRRGVALPAAALAAVLDSRSASASISSPLCDITTRAAIRFAAGPATGEALSASTAALAQEVLRSMLIHKLKLVALTVLVLGAVATGAVTLSLGALAHSREGEPPGEPIVGEARQEPRPLEMPPAHDATRPAPGRMFVVGRVLAPDGKPVPGATIGVSVRRRTLFTSMGSEEILPAPVGQATSGPDGRFRLDTPRTSSSQHAEFGVTAVAPGYGIAWADLDPDADEPTIDLTLPPEQVIEGRLRDVAGRPAAGVRVSVASVLRVGPVPRLRTAQGRVIESLEGPTRWWLRINDLPGWPKPATSDAEGRFEIHGIGPDIRVYLSALDPRFAPQTAQASTEAGARPLRWTLQPARVLNGRVTYGDTGRPVAHAEVLVSATEPGKGTRLTLVAADAEGRFRARPAPGPHVTVGATPPDGQPYSRGGKGLDWPPGAADQSIDVALPRGALIHGKITEEGTGRPVAGATVFFSTYAPRLGRTEGSGWARTKADGTFAIGVGAHPGHLAIHGPDEDYRLQAVSNSQFYQGQGGGLRVYAHAFVACDPRPGDVEVNVALRRGATVMIRLIGPDGEPVRDVWVYSRAVQHPLGAGIVRTWLLGYHDVARNGHFRVHGLDPDAEVPVYLLQPERKLGATVRLSGRSGSGGPVTVRLEPCGTAMARLLGPDGRPIAGQPRGLSITMAITPGLPAGSAEERAGALAADEAALGRIDPVNHLNPPLADAQGRITLPALIPGATYRILDRSTVAARDVGPGPQVRREFIIGPGEAVELGDIQFGKPPR